MANYQLVIETYRQGTNGRSEVSGITSPSLHSIPMDEMDNFKKQEKRLKMKYIPVWQVESKWTCIFRGKSKYSYLFTS